MLRHIGIPLLQSTPASARCLSPPRFVRPLCLEPLHAACCRALVMWWICLQRPHVQLLRGTAKLFWAMIEQHLSLTRPSRKA